MKAQASQQLNFGNWVPGKMIAGPGILALVCLGLGALHWAFLIPAALFLIITGYFAASWYLFWAKGGRVQDQILELLVSHLRWSGRGKVLDIGCGNGPLVIKIAQCYPDSEVTGTDYWGKNWDYSMQAGQQNARLAGVAGRVTFKRGSASALAFEDASFDVVVSNLTFHEVADVADKRKCIQEALRVLKPGGIFVLQDLFLLGKLYGTPEALVSTIRGWGVPEVELIRTCDAPFIPKLVKLPFMVGTMALLKGKK